MFQNYEYCGGDIIAFASNQHNVSPSHGGILMLEPSTTGLAITGIVPPFADAQMNETIKFCIVNRTGNAVTLKHNNANSAVGNRIFVNNNSDYTLGAYIAVQCIYMNVSGRVGWWIVADNTGIL